MRQENAKMMKFLKVNGIEVKAKFIFAGSLKNCWRLSNLAIDWHESPELWQKLNDLGFSDFDGQSLGKYSGNGGKFSIFARYFGEKNFFNA